MLTVNNFNYEATSSQSSSKSAELSNSDAKIVGLSTHNLPKPLEPQNVSKNKKRKARKLQQAEGNANAGNSKKTTESMIQEDSEDCSVPKFYYIDLSSIAETPEETLFLKNACEAVPLLSRAFTPLNLICNYTYSVFQDFLKGCNPKIKDNPLISKIALNLNNLFYFSTYLTTEKYNRFGAIKQESSNNQLLPFEESIFKLIRKTHFEHIKDLNLFLEKFNSLIQSENKACLNKSKKIRDKLKENIDSMHQLHQTLTAFNNVLCTLLTNQDNFKTANHKVLKTEAMESKTLKKTIETHLELNKEFLKGSFRLNCEEIHKETLNIIKNIEELIKLDPENIDIQKYLLFQTQTNLLQEQVIEKTNGYLLSIKNNAEGSIKGVDFRIAYEFDNASRSLLSICSTWASFIQYKFHEQFDIDYLSIAKLDSTTTLLERLSLENIPFLGNYQNLEALTPFYKNFEEICQKESQLKLRNLEELLPKKFFSDIQYFYETIYSLKEWSALKNLIPPAKKIAKQSIRKNVSAVNLSLKKLLLEVNISDLIEQETALKRRLNEIAIHHMRPLILRHLLIISFDNVVKKVTENPLSFEDLKTIDPKEFSKLPEEIYTELDRLECDTIIDEIIASKLPELVLEKPEEDIHIQPEKPITEASSSTAKTNNTPPDSSISRQALDISIDKTSRVQDRDQIVKFKWPKNTSARKVLKDLLSEDFQLVSQKGSHCKLVKQNRCVIVPNHSGSLKTGTLSSITDMANGEK